MEGGSCACWLCLPNIDTRHDEREAERERSDWADHLSLLGIAEAEAGDWWDVRRPYLGGMWSMESP